MAKQNKLAQIANGQTKSQPTVFNRNLFPGANTQQVVQNNETKYIRGNISLENILLDENTDISSLSTDTIESIKEYLVSPIILKQEYEEAERGGRKFRKKTGKYIILDGNKRAKIYKDAGKSEIFSLVLPLDITKDEEVKFVDNARNRGVTQAVEKIQTTTEGEITNCYHYEVQEVPEEKLEERENKYAILDSEVEALADSIWSVGILQPIVVLPELDFNSQVHYIIQAGHKRVKAIRKLKTDCLNPDSKYYIYKDTILEKFKTIPALIIPSGATQQEIEQIYNETNLLSRHMTSEDVFAHISCIGPQFRRPTTQTEFNEFMGQNKSMTQYVREAQNYFKKLGFKDWANSKTSYFLNVHFFGSDKAVELFEKCGDTTIPKEERIDLTQKEIYWVVIHNNDFAKRVDQDTILENALEDKTTLIELMAASTPLRKTKSVKVKQLNKNIAKQKTALEKMKSTPIELTKKDKEDLQKTKELIKETQNILKSFEVMINELDKN